LALAPTYVSALPDGKQLHVVGDMKEWKGTGTVGAADTYVNPGGSAVAASSFGMQQITFMDPIIFSTGHWGQYNPATGKLVVFSASGTELVNASAALQNATFQATVVGK
jgi:hypothetical protein